MPFGHGYQVGTLNYYYLFLFLFFFNNLAKSELHLLLKIILFDILKYKDNRQGMEYQYQ